MGGDGPPMTLAALEAMRPAQRPPDYWDQFERFGSMLYRHRWIFAKTMPQNPHHYTLRKEWERDADFQWAVTFLRMYGYTAYYQRRAYVQIDLNEHFYWTMGWPINRPSGAPCTILINRKRHEAVQPYDTIADQYDRLFHEPEYERENAQLADMIGPLREMDVLDVGCGTGLTLDLWPDIDPLRYMGIDPAARMLAKLKQRHPVPCTMQTKLGSFLPPQAPEGLRRYDTILALFGVGSYLSPAELERIPSLLNPGGRACVMFYGEGYFPDTYLKTDLNVTHTPWQGQFPGAVHTLGRHVLVEYHRPPATGAAARTFAGSSASSGA